MEITLNGLFEKINTIIWYTWTEQINYNLYANEDWTLDMIWFQLGNTNYRVYTNEEYLDLLNKYWIWEHNLISVIDLDSEWSYDKNLNKLYVYSFIPETK